MHAPAKLMLLNAFIRRGSELDVSSMWIKMQRRKGSYTENKSSDSSSLQFESPLPWQQVSHNSMLTGSVLPLLRSLRKFQLILCRFLELTGCDGLWMRFRRADRRGLASRWNVKHPGLRYQVRKCLRTRKWKNTLSPFLETFLRDTTGALSSGAVQPGGGIFPAAAQAPTISR